MSIWKEARFVRKGNYLHGSFVKSPEVDGYINSVNPGNLDDFIGKFPFSESSADVAVALARDAFEKWHRASIETRMLCLHRYRDQLSASMDQLACFLTRETGKPYWESHAEVLFTIKLIDVTLEYGMPQLDPWRLAELDGGCEFHPRGVIALLCPYNLPLLTPNTHIIPALLAGNTIVYKPSKYTPAIGQLIAELIDRARFPRGVVNLIQGSGKVVGSRLVTHPDVDAIHLDGSLETAFEIRKLTLVHPWKRLVLNSCGRGTAIVLDDAALDKATYEIIVGAFLTTGQRRSATTRVIATAGIYPRLAERLRQVMCGIRIGQGFRDDVYMGPLISEASRKRFLHYVASTEEEGHEQLFRGERVELETSGYYVTPSLFSINPSVQREFLTSEEIVGPAIELYHVTDFEEAVAVHNRSKLRLVTSIFTSDDSLIREARYALRTGVINVNRSTVSLSARLPLEGQFGSSNGVSMGLYAIRSCTYPLSYLEDHRPFDRSQVIPGIVWPEVEDEVTAPRMANEEDSYNDVTVSDLLIPQDDTLSLPRNLVDPPEPESLPFKPD